MRKINNLKIITILSLPLAVALAVASYSGAFVESTYELDSASLAAQGAGQDMVDLFLVVPLLLLSLIFLHRKSRIAVYVFSGTIFYILYSFFIYCFGVHFNHLFLWYCATLGLSLYVFILVMSGLGGMEVEGWFGGKAPTRTAGIYLILIAAMFYLLWLKDIIPALVNRTLPSSVSDYNLLVNPVHVLDIAIALPGLVLAAVLLMRKRRFGYILAPAALVFTVILSISLAGMVAMSRARGFSDDASIAVIFIVLAVISAALLALFMRALKNPG